MLRRVNIANNDEIDYDNRTIFTKIIVYENI